MSHSAEKCKTGTFRDLITYIQLKISRNSTGGPFGDSKKFSKKVEQCRKKIKRGDPLVSFRFVGPLKNIKKRMWRPFALSLHWPDLTLGGFRIVSKKWTDQCEDCSLKKNKTRTSEVGAISKTQKAQNIFFGKKNLKFLKFFLFRKMSHIAEKCKRGTLFDL